MKKITPLLNSVLLGSTLLSSIRLNSERLNFERVKKASSRLASKPIQSIQSTQSLQPILGTTVAAFVAVTMFALTPFEAKADDFSNWIDGVQVEARANGIDEVYIAALDDLTPNETVRRLAARQPEYIKPIWEYLDHMITPNRLKVGNEKLEAYSDILAELEAEYGVPRQVLVTIWGMETNYGTIKGSFPVLEALASLGYEGRRAKFGRQQLLAALEILQAGDVELKDFKGSWAGAMGHTQFIPTTYLAYAVDATNDGKRDIWNNPHDALGSTASYLKVSGWKTGLPWGVQVKLPTGFDYSWANLKVKKQANTWMALGVEAQTGSIDPDWGKTALYLPAGHRGPAFLVTKNFFAILRYNTAPAYGLSVGELSDRLAGKSDSNYNWPIEARPLLPKEIKEMQAILVKAGYEIGAVDGVPGPLTREAVLQFQKQNGILADGYATPGFLQELRKTVRK